MKKPLVEWSNPPEDGRGRKCYAWGDAIEELKRHPGKWAILMKDGKSPLNKWRFSVSYRDNLEIQVRSRVDEHGARFFTSYVRWIGKKERP